MTNESPLLTSDSPPRSSDAPRPVDDPPPGQGKPDPVKEPPPPPDDEPSDIDESPGEGPGKIDDPPSPEHPGIRVVIIFMRMWIPERPRWVMAHGRVAAAEAVVAGIEQRVCLAGASLMIAAAGARWWAVAAERKPLDGLAREGALR